MRDWRNRQTRTFKGRVGDRVSSSLTSRTKKRATQLSVALFLCARLPRKRQLATSVANVRRSSMSARHWRHLRLPLPKHLAPSRIKRSLTEACCSFFVCDVVAKQLATLVANVRRSSMSAGHWRHLRLPLPKHLAPFRIKTFFNRRVLLFFLRARLFRKRQLATISQSSQRLFEKVVHFPHFLCCVCI